MVRERHPKIRIYSFRRHKFTLENMWWYEGSTTWHATKEAALDHFRSLHGKYKPILRAEFAATHGHYIEVE